MLSVAKLVGNENWKKLFAASLPLHSFANVFSCEVKSSVYSLSFCSSHFSILVFGLFCQWSYANTKILCNLRLHFARQDEQDGKKQKENHASKVTKIPAKNQKKKIWDEPNITWVLTYLLTLLTCIFLHSHLIYRKLHHKTWQIEQLLQSL